MKEIKLIPRSPCTFASTADLCLWHHPRSGVLTQTQNSICKHFWNLSNSRVHSSPGPAFTPELCDAIGKSILYKNATFYFSCNVPRRSVTRCAMGERWFMATHQLPGKIPKLMLNHSTQQLTGRPRKPFWLQTQSSDFPEDGGWMSALGDFGSLEKIWHFIGILNPDVFSYWESKCAFLCG